MKRYDIHQIYSVIFRYPHKCLYWYILNTSIIKNEQISSTIFSYFDGIDYTCRKQNDIHNHW